MTLTDEQLNIAICEWLGWDLDPIECRGWESRGQFVKAPGFGGLSSHNYVPSHITGIEALGNMHEAEKGLTEQQEVYYREYVYDLCRQDGNRGYQATSRQRAIAMLRVVRPELFTE